MGLIPRLGRSPREGLGNLLQCSWLENSMDRGAWQAVVHGSAKTGHTHEGEGGQKVKGREDRRSSEGKKVASSK